MKIVTLSLLFAVSMLSANESKINLECYPYQFMVGGKVTRELTKENAQASGLTNTISYNSKDMKLQNASTIINLAHVDTQKEGDIPVEIYKDVNSNIMCKINPKDISSLAMDWGNRVIINYKCEVK
ncbi:hypothetical protein [Sulfurimonas sp.]|uniref:hypothetical protein n=1 Tax=Sulfurimonas sp. TaxID=2022749 RepID=UPI002B469562|nr:hypothetical protein [Sulfurimonas sp.]